MAFKFLLVLKIYAPTVSINDLKVFVSICQDNTTPTCLYWCILSYIVIYIFVYVDATIYMMYNHGIPGPDIVDCVQVMLVSVHTPIPKWISQVGHEL